MKRARWVVRGLVLVLCYVSWSAAFAQGTTFTYQGRLSEGPTPASGNYDFSFQLFDAPTGGASQSVALITNAVALTDGLFTLPLDFGPNAFTEGAPRWLEIRVRLTGSGTFGALVPRQAVTATPYAITAAKLTGSINSSSLSGTYANALVLSNANNQFIGSYNGNGSGLINVNADSVGGVASANLWQLGGNTIAPGQFLGSTNKQPLELWVNGLRALRLEHVTNDIFSTNAVNVVLGSPANSVALGVRGATIAGGGATMQSGPFPGENSVAADFGTIGGGVINSVSGRYATISGGWHNEARGRESVVGGGTDNAASGSDSTVGGGSDNTASGEGATVSGGNLNLATAPYSMVPGGFGNIAEGEYSFAAGDNATASHAGSFVWAASGPGLSSTANDQFNVLGAGGFRFFTRKDKSAGAQLAPDATAWTTLSDRNAKKNFAPVDGRQVLETLGSVPVQKWNYKWEPDDSTPHIGPTAQDFKHAFYPGRDDKGITTLEFDGVALAAIQGLNQKLDEVVKEKDGRIERLEKANLALQEQLTELKAAVQKLTP